MLRGLEGALGSSFSSEPFSPPSNPLVIVISGPSGVGKDAVIKVLHLQVFHIPIKYLDIFGFMFVVTRASPQLLIGIFALCYASRMQSRLTDLHCT